MCGIWEEYDEDEDEVVQKGTYDAEGIVVIAEALKVQASLTSVRWPPAHEPLSASAPPSHAA